MARRKLMIAVLLVAIGGNRQAEAQAPTALQANTLVSYCRAVDKTRDPLLTPSSIDALGTGLCLGYLRGIMDASVWAEFMSPPDIRPLFCLPVNVNVNQLLRVYLLYMDTHPERLHLEASVTVIDSLAKAFPCTGKYR